MYLFDTNILSEPLKIRPNPGVVARLNQCPARARFVSALSLEELKFGYLIRGDGGRLWVRVQSEVLRHVRVLPFDSGAALECARLRHRLKKKGTETEFSDLLIGATATYHNLILVTRNSRHFARIPGLRFENWFQ